MGNVEQCGICQAEHQCCSDVPVGVAVPKTEQFPRITDANPDLLELPEAASARFIRDKLSTKSSFEIEPEFEDYVNGDYRKYNRRVNGDYERFEIEPQYFEYDGKFNQWKKRVFLREAMRFPDLYPVVRYIESKYLMKELVKMFNEEYGLQGDDRLKMMETRHFMQNEFAKDRNKFIKEIEDFLEEAKEKGEKYIAKPSFSEFSEGFRSNANLPKNKADWEKYLIKQFDVTSDQVITSKYERSIMLQAYYGSSNEVRLHMICGEFYYAVVSYSGKTKKLDYPPFDASFSYDAEIYEYRRNDDVNVMNLFFERDKKPKKLWQHIVSQAEKVARFIGSPYLRVDFFYGSEEFGLRLNEMELISGINLENKLDFQRFDLIANRIAHEVVVNPEHKHLYTLREKSRFAHSSQDDASQRASQRVLASSRQKSAIIQKSGLTLYKLLNMYLIVSLVIIMM